MSEAQTPRPLVSHSKPFDPYPREGIDPYPMDRSMSQFMKFWNVGVWNKKTLDDPYTMDDGMERMSMHIPFHPNALGHTHFSDFQAVAEILSARRQLLFWHMRTRRSQVIILV